MLEELEGMMKRAVKLWVGFATLYIFFTLNLRISLTATNYTSASSSAVPSDRTYSLAVSDRKQVVRTGPLHTASFTSMHCLPLRFLIKLLCMLLRLGRETGIVVDGLVSQNGLGLNGQTKYFPSRTPRTSPAYDHVCQFSLHSPQNVGAWITMSLDHDEKEID